MADPHIEPWPVADPHIAPSAHIRVARPSGDLVAAERFYTAGLGMRVQFRADGGPGEHDLLMVGLPGAPWHLELVGGPGLIVRPQPTAEDLLVIYLAGPVDDDLVARLESCGGTRVSQGDYWDRWGVTIADPDGYRLVLSTRSWSTTT